MRIIKNFKNIQRKQASSYLVLLRKVVIFDLINLATIKEWSLKITIIDLIWGFSLSNIVSTITYYFYMLIK
ncbi:MAG: DUF2177 family protein [Bacilli bacterium]|nr:DUF2177 family protein [Bacilli bacterium]MDD4547332.1 DUF2177 family protein [Bacilli bacterium]